MDNEKHIPKRISIRNESSQETPIRLTRRGKLAVKAIGAGLGFALAAGGAAAVIEANDSDFRGKQVERIDDEQTVTDLAQHVEGHEGHLNATIDKIVEMNPEVFQDGKAYVGSEDIGKDVDLPKSVD